MAWTHRGPYIWVTDQVRGQDGWILAKFFFACLWTKLVDLWTEMESRSINKNNKKGQGQYSAIVIEQANDYYFP